MSILRINGLSHMYDDKVLFKNADLSINNGEHVGIVGLNGAGKSTFINIIAHNISQDEGEVIWLSGIRYGYLDQHADIDRSLTVMEYLQTSFTHLYELDKKLQKLYEEMGSVTDEKELDRMIERSNRMLDTLTREHFYDIEAQIKKVANGLGVNAFGYDTVIGTLSGGQRAKLMLAKLILEEPDVMLLDEPTNFLDVEHVDWLIKFLNASEKTFMVISHDVEFLDGVCKYIVSIENGSIRKYTGNYSQFLVQHEMAVKQYEEDYARQQAEIKRMEDYIARNKARAATAGMANSRKKMLEKLNIEEIKPSMRKYPGIIFQPEREPGTKILAVDGLSKTVGGETLFRNVSFTIEKGDKVAFLSREPRAITALFEIVAGDDKPDSGMVEWGVTINPAYLPLNNAPFFDNQLTIVDWLAQFSQDTSELYLRGYLGKMLFSGDEIYKQVNVLSGGEKMRCMIARMMIRQANTLLLDSPTNHLDLESIQAFNNALVAFKGVVLMTSHDHEFINTVANRIIEITPNGMVDKYMEYDDYLFDERVQENLNRLYTK